MAFVIDNFKTLTTGNTPDLYYYKTEDDISTVLGANYFAGVFAAPYSTQISDICRVSTGAYDVVDEKGDYLVRFVGRSSNDLTAQLLGYTAAPENLTSATSITFDDNGKSFSLDAAGGFQVTLPFVADGFKVRFYVETAPSGGDYTIVTAGSANLIAGGFSASDGLAAATDTNGDTITFVDGSAAIGDMVEIEFVNDLWFVNGRVAVAAGATITST